MKKITLLFAGLMVAALSSDLKAQTYDVGVVALPSVAGGYTAYPNVSTSIQYTRENFGSAVTSAVVDSFTMEIFVDQIKRQTFYRNMGSPFGVSASETTQGITPIDWSTLGISAGQVSVCARTRLWKSGSMIDANPNNDEKCEVVTYAGDNNPLTYDFTPENIVLKDVFNSYPCASALPAGMSLVELSFDLKNNSSVQQLPDGIPFQVTVEIDGNVSQPLNGVSQAMSPGGSVTYTIDAFANGISLPQGKTQFEACVKLVATSDDTDNSNDEFCCNFTVQVGIEEAASTDQFELNYFNRTLTINTMEAVSGMVDVDIISLSGQVVQNTSFNAELNRNYEMDMSQLNTGVYIAKVSNERGFAQTMRFVVE
jgi:hypothetical protein